MDDKSDTILIENLSQITTEPGLRFHFESYGLVKCVEIIRNEDGKSQGYGYIRYRNPEDAYIAVPRLNNSVLDNRNISVRFCFLPSEAPIEDSTSKSVPKISSSKLDRESEDKNISKSSKSKHKHSSRHHSKKHHSKPSRHHRHHDSYSSESESRLNNSNDNEPKTSYQPNQFESNTSQQNEYYQATNFVQTPPSYYKSFTVNSDQTSNSTSMQKEFNYQVDQTQIPKENQNPPLLNNETEQIESVVSEKDKKKNKRKKHESSDSDDYSSYSYSSYSYSYSDSNNSSQHK